MLNIVVSTIVFFIAAWYIRRFLEEQGLPKGMTRSTLIFLLASLLSWGAAALMNLAGEPEPEVMTTEGLTRLLQEAQQQQQ